MTPPRCLPPAWCGRHRDQRLVDRRHLSQRFKLSTTTHERSSYTAGCTNAGNRKRTQPNGSQRQPNDAEPERRLCRGIQANRRYLYFAAKADVEGENDVSAVFRSTAEGETGHAHGHLEYLETVGDPATGLPIGTTSDNLKAAIAGETYEYTDMYPGMAKTARGEGFDEISDWFETLAKAERSHANRFRKALDAMD